MRARPILAAALVIAFAGAASAIACGDYSEAPPGASADGGDGGGIDTGTPSETDSAIEEASSLVRCGISGCSPTCCLARDASTPPACCGGNTSGWDFVLECASDVNCAADEVCCIFAGVTQTLAQCASASACSARGGAQMCDGDSIDPRCPNSLKCRAAQAEWGIPAPYAVCRFVN